MIGENSIVAGHSLVKEGAIFPPNCIVAGTPAKIIAQRNNFVANRLNALAYYDNGLAYAAGNHRIWSEEAQQRKMAQRKIDLEKLLAGEHA